MTIFPRPTASPQALSYLVYGQQSHRKSFHCHVLLYRAAYSRFIPLPLPPSLFTGSTQRRDCIEREREPETFRRWSVATFKKRDEGCYVLPWKSIDDDQQATSPRLKHALPDDSPERQKELICFRKNDSFRENIKEWLGNDKYPFGDNVPFLQQLDAFQEGKRRGKRSMRETSERKVEVGVCFAKIPDEVVLEAFSRKPRARKIRSANPFF